MKRVIPKLNIQHDYITLKLPIGNFTQSYRGGKATGQLAHMKDAFLALDNYVNTSPKSVGDAMQELTNPLLLDELVPGWDKLQIVENFEPTDTVVFINDIYKKEYPGTYTVKSVKGKYVYIETFNKKYNRTEVIGFDKFELKKV